MLHVYIVTYDICDPERLRRVYRCMRGWGDHLQYSVFRCVLNPVDLARLRAQLEELVHHTEDQVLFCNLGPAEGRGREAVSSVGLSYTHPERHAIVV
jgi:CRISPR-associated protein Cas2